MYPMAYEKKKKKAEGSSFDIIKCKLTMLKVSETRICMCYSQTTPGGPFAKV